MSEKPKRILINMETQTEFQARLTCLNPDCSSPLPMGLINTLCTKCQEEQNVFSQQEIDEWRKTQHVEITVAGQSRPKEAMSMDDYLDNLIKVRDEKKKDEVGPKVKVDVVNDKPLKDLLSADSGDSVVTNI